MKQCVSAEQPYGEEINRLRDAIEKKMGKSPETLCEEREKRVTDTIRLKEPDRVPVYLGMSYFPARYTGIPNSSAYYDAAGWKEANRKAILDFEPDLYRAAARVSSGLAHKALGTLQIQWPGGTLPHDASHQFVPGEYMKEDEYDLFLSDPSDFVLRCYLPRVFRALEPLSRIPPLRNFITETNFVSIIALFATPEFEEVAGVLRKAGQEQKKCSLVMENFVEEMTFLGFPPPTFGVGIGAPFDAIADFLRGMHGAMIDMHRRPDKLLAACEKVLQMRTALAAQVGPKKRGGSYIVFMPLHWGAKNFMSRKQFETFYWPGLKKAILAVVDLGLVPMPFFEGRYGDRLEYLLELPKGKVICYFEDTDMSRAKEVLGDHLCISGNVPSSLLQLGSPQQVDEYCKTLIQVCGKSGGFILTHGSVIDQAKPENVKAMIDSVKKYSP